jgi:hypothetical protein
MTWSGYPQGRLNLFLNGDWIGEKNYDPRYNRGDPFADSIAVGLRPPQWTGEIIQTADGQENELRPDDLMWVGQAGIEIKDLRLYQRALSQPEIQQLSTQEPSSGNQ